MKKDVNYLVDIFIDKVIVKNNCFLLSLKDINAK